MRADSVILTSFIKIPGGIVMLVKRSAIFAIILFAVSVLPWNAYPVNLNTDNTRVYFSPHGNCTRSIVREIGNARSEILVQAYSFTSAPIAKALVDVHKRGVKVKVILDKSQRKEKYTSATFLSNMGIPTCIDDKHAIAHNKIIILDGKTVITGSFNFTKAAEEKNAENLLIIKSADLAKLYINNWKEHREHSEAYR